MSNNVAVQQQSNKPSVKALFERPDVGKRFAEVLGKRAPQFVTSILQLAASDKILAVADPYTVYNAAMTAASLDLPVNKNLGFAWIIGYKNNAKQTTEAQFQLGYKGYIQLAQRTGQYSKINCVEVYENQFKSWNALTEELDADFSSEGTGRVVGYCGFFRLLNGYEKTVYWSSEKVKAHATRFSKNFKFNDSTWKTDFDAMAKKTVLKNMLSTWGILSVELQNALKVDQAVIKNEEEVEYPDYQDANVLSKEEERMMQMIDAAQTEEELNALVPHMMESMGERFRNKLEQIQAAKPVVVEEVKEEKKAAKKQQDHPIEYFKSLVDNCKSYKDYEGLQEQANSQEKVDYLNAKIDEFVNAEMEKQSKSTTTDGGLF
jgi:recombination protein RecT